MAIAKLKCPTCNGPAIILSERIIAGLRVKMYQCGHADIEKQMTPTDFADYVSLDGKKPYKYQIEGALFGINANARILIMDEQGLGKTVQAAMVLWSHSKELCRCCIIARAGLTVQWQNEIVRWNGEDWSAQIIRSELDHIIPGMQVVILSMDTLWRFSDISAWMKKAKIKSLILDEVQHLKNSNSKRTKGVQIAAREVKHIIALSGTPIANHAGEFFPILNILRPDHYRTRAEFTMKYVDTYWNGHSMKYGGLQNPARFKSETSDFIIRRTRAEVLPDLPAITRDFRFTELGDKVEAAYKDLYKQFMNYYNNSSDDAAFVRQSNILAYLSKMRHLTGIAKIEPLVSYLEDFMTSVDRKIVIFTHHIDIAKKLLELLSEQQQKDPATWGGEILRMPDQPELRQATINQFRDSDSRILLAGTLASSEGINLQFCADAVMLERQWTPIKEEQAEGRFPRPGQTADKIFVTYMIAVGTVDEFLTKLVERKRSFCASAIDGKEYEWNESSIIQELAAVLATTGGKQWGW